MKRKTTVLILLVLILFGCNSRNSKPVSQQKKSVEHPGKLSKEKMKWFTDAKFGLFIHWGPYSIFEGEWNGRQVPVGENAEWIMQKLQIPVNAYRKTAATFNPVHFNPEEWTNLALNAGMKYLVITSKHHDGFAMYNSEVSDYNIVDYTPFDRDPMKELSEACNRKDIRFCFYYSHREDWDEPYAYGNFWDFKTSQQKGYEYETEKAEFFESYLENKAKPQLRELLTGYGPVGLIWFDRGLYTPEQGFEFIKIIRELQPECLVNGRVGSYNLELIGDYQNLSDNGMPASGVDELWETPQTLNETWGYSRFDTLWKTPTEVIHRLAEVVSKGGNYLLNIGPKGDGSIPEASVKVLEEVGSWMQKNSESIYGTTASPLPFHNWGFCTAKDSALYLHVLHWPEENYLEITNLKNNIIRAVSIDNSNTYEVSFTGGNHRISLDKVNRNAHNTVIKIILDGKPITNPETITIDEADTVLLDNMTVRTTGKVVKRYNRGGLLFMSKWNVPGDRANWMLDFKKAGSYKAVITYSAPQKSIGASYTILFGSNKITGKIENTGIDFDYKSFEVGSLDLKNPGKYNITIHPTEPTEGDLMYFKSLKLIPVVN